MVNWRFWEKSEKKVKRVISSKVKKGMTILAKEHVAFLKLREDLQQLVEDLQKHIKDKELGDVRIALRDLRFLGRAERRLKPTEEEIEAALETLVTRVKSPSGTLAEVTKHIETIKEELKVEAGKILTAASRYEGKIHDLLIQLQAEVAGSKEQEAKETIEEIEKIIDEVDQKWIPALAADFKRARRIEENFVRESGAKEAAQSALSEGRFSDAARLFLEADLSKRAISALDRKRPVDFTPEDYELLKRASVAARDANRAGDAVIIQDEAVLLDLISKHEVGKLAQHLDAHLVKMYIRCGDKLLAAWERLLERIGRAPFNRLNKKDKEWLLGFINQKLLNWEVAARHYDNAGDFASSVLCWAKTKNKVQLERAKRELQKQRGK
ncbi:hypothetical protein HYT55_02410 [Candidatus Woesearchaeota archaeon]|nr:hypothetical protein [Candidatus Woesearchaeota archaeon]